MSDEAFDHITYLLRLWRAGGDEPRWRAALENPRTGERQVFGDLASLCAFLQEKTGNAPLIAEKAPPTPGQKPSSTG